MSHTGNWIVMFVTFRLASKISRKQQEYICNIQYIFHLTRTFVVVNLVNVDGEGHLQQLRNCHTLLLICNVFSDTRAMLLETFVLLSANSKTERGDLRIIQ